MPLASFYFPAYSHFPINTCRAYTFLQQSSRYSIDILTQGVFSSNNGLRPSIPHALLNQVFLPRSKGVKPPLLL